MHLVGKKRMEPRGGSGREILEGESVWFLFYVIL